MDTSAFCRGVNIALETNGLAIRGLGDPGHLSQCEFHSFSNYGVQLILTGDIVLPEQEEENAGFNSIMIPRIKDSLGSTYELLGKMDSSWHDLNEQDFAFAIASTFEFEVLSDSTVKFVLNPELVSTSIFGSFEGIKFSDHNQNWVSCDSLYVGVTFLRNKSDYVYIIVVFTNYTNENNICQAFGKFVVPVKIE